MINLPSVIVLDNLNFFGAGRGTETEPAKNRVSGVSVAVLQKKMERERSAERKVAELEQSGGYRCRPTGVTYLFRNYFSYSGFP